MTFLVRPRRAAELAASGLVVESAAGDFTRPAPPTVLASDQILQEMWEKWVFLAAFAGSTCLLRAAICDILNAPGGREIVLGLIEECRAIAQASGFPPGEPAIERFRSMLTASGSPLTASMARDIENHNPVEADHIIGDFIHRGERTGSLPGEDSLLRLAYTHLKAYEAREERSRSER